MKTLCHSCFRMHNRLAVLLILAVSLAFVSVNCKKNSTTVTSGDGTPAAQAFVLVQGGTFTMGNPVLSPNDLSHKVTLSSYYISNIEVSQALWVSVMDSTMSFMTGDNLPAQVINWYDAVSFCNKLSVKNGRTPCYTVSGSKDPSTWPTTDTATMNKITCDFTANGYRLPTEAEWEFAARGGLVATAQSNFSGSDSPDAVAWYLGNASGVVHTVGTKSANALGLYDMSGNVDEWCWDKYAAFKADSVANPKGAAAGAYRVIRGGCWLDESANCFTSWRQWDDPACPRATTTPRVRSERYGLRLVTNQP